MNVSNKDIKYLSDVITALEKEIEKKDKIITDLLNKISSLEYDNERLENIIKAIEKALKDNIEELKDLTFSYDRINEDKEILKLIQELKGEDKE